MSKFDFGIKIRDNEVKRRLIIVTAGLKDLSKPLIRAKDTVLRETDRQWGSKGKNLGTPWKGRKVSQPWPILQKTGNLRGSFTWKPQSPTKSVTILSRLEKDYFPYHQAGKGDMHRPMLVLSPALIKSIEFEFKSYINKLL